MDTMSAFARGLAAQGNPRKVFDWNKAAQLIKERKPKVAEAGLQDDWEYTGGCIYREGAPDTGEYCYLASTWATPELSLDGDVVDCYIMEQDVPSEWGKDFADIRWPASALAILSDG